MNSRQYRIVENTLKQLIAEAPAQETDNITSDSTAVFTPAQEKFLGKFDAYGTEHLGVIYSISDVGIQEFIARSGKDLNITPGILLSLLRSKAIKIVPYGGWGRDNNYTIELQLSLDDIAGMGAEDKKNIEAGSASSGAPAPGAEPPAPEPPAPGPENAWVVRYGDILSESAQIVKDLFIKTNKKSETITEKIKKTTTSIKNINEFHELPKHYRQFMERVVSKLQQTQKNTKTNELIIAEVLSILSDRMKISISDIKQSYKLHESTKKLQNFLK